MPTIIIYFIISVEISRLRNTWDRVPNKELKMYRQMQQLLDVSGNMRLLRSLHKSCKPPVIPMAALVTKDLTTIHEVHPTKVDPDGPDTAQKSDIEYLINFDKLRIMANRARSFKNLLYGCGTSLNVSTESSLVLPDDESAQIVYVRDMLSKIDHKGCLIVELLWSIVLGVIWYEPIVQNRIYYKIRTSNQPSTKKCFRWDYNSVLLPLRDGHPLSPNYSS